MSIEYYNALSRCGRIVALSNTKERAQTELKRRMNKLKRRRLNPWWNLTREQRVERESEIAAINKTLNNL